MFTCPYLYNRCILCLPVHICIIDVVYMFTCPYLYNRCSVHVYLSIRLVRLVVLALGSLDSNQPLSFLSSSVVEHLPSKQYVVGSSELCFHIITIQGGRLVSSMS